MVIGAKDVRSIKVSNLPGNISNDVLRFLFKESTSVIRAPHSTTAVVEFNCVRDVAAYIHKDKTLMVEDKVLTIEGCSSKNEGTSNKDPLESRQLYIENIPHWTTTEYLDVLFPGAKSIRRVDGFTAVAEYRSAKDAQLELLKTKTLRIDQNQLVVVCAKDYRRNTSNNDGNPAQNVGRYSLSRKGKGYQSSYARKPGSGNERPNPNSNSGGSYHSHKRHSASGSQNQDDNSSANSLVTPSQDQLLSGNSTQANLLGLPQAFGKSSKSFQWKKPGSHHYSNVRSCRRHGPSRNTKENKDGATAEGEDCGDHNADSVGVHDPDGDGDVVEKSCVEAKSSGQPQQQQQMKRTATTVIGQNQKDSKTRQGSGSAVGPTQKEAKANPAASSSSSSVLGRNQKEAKVTQKSTATEGVSVNQKEAKTNQKSAETGQNQTEAKANKKAPPTSKERSVTSRRESSTTHRSNSGTSKTVRSRSSSTKPIRDRSPHRDCPSKRMRTTDVPPTHATGRGHSKTSRETTSPSSNDASKGHRHGDMQQGQSATTKKEDGSVTSSVSNLLNKLDMLAALSQFAKDYEDAYQTTQKGSQKKCHETENDKEKAMAPAGSTNNSKSKNRVLDRTMPHTSSTGSSRVRHRGDSSKNSDSINRGTSHDHGRSTRASDPSRARHRGDNSGGDGSCDSANRRGTSRLRGSSHSTSWMSEPYMDSLRDHHRHHSQSTNMATTTDSRSARSRRSPCYDVNEGGGVGRRSYLEMRNSEKYQLRGHSYHHGDNFDHDLDRHDRDEWNGPRFWSENDSGRSRSSYANADVDLIRLSEVRGRSSEERGSSQSGSERRVWISGRVDHRNSGQGRSYQRDFRPDVNYENPDLRRWDESEYDAGGGGRRGRWEREEEEEVGRDGIGQRFSETSGPCGGRDRFGSSSYNDYNYDCYDDDDDGGDSGRRGVFDGRGGKWTEDRRDMYERRKTFEEPFRAVHLNSGNDRLAFGDGERGEEEVEREGRFQQESNERRYNHPDLDNDYHLHGNRRATLSSSSSPSTHDNNNTSRSQSRDYYDGSSSSSHRAPLHDNRRVTTTAMSINPSKSEPRDYEGDGTRHRGKRQNMNPHPYGPDARTFRKGRDQGTAGSSSCRGDKEWSVASRDVDERTVFLTNSVKHGGENCSRVNNADGGGGGGAGGGRDAVRLGLGGKCQVGGSGADGSREAGGRFSSDVRCESGRFVGAEGRCKVGRFGSDGWSEGADERYSSSRMGPNDDEDCKGGRFGANESYEAGRFDIDERCMVSRFDVDERCATDRFDGDKRLTTADVNDAEKRGPRTSECDHDPSASRIDQQGADGNNMGGRKFGVAAGSLGSCGGIDGSATNFRVGKSCDGGSRLDRSVNSDMQDCQLAFDVYERERFAPSEMEKTHNRNANGMRFNRHRGVDVGNSPKTVRALEERVNDKDDGGGGDRLMREDDKTDVHAASSGTGGGGGSGGDDGGYGNHGENRDIDDRVFQQYSSNHNNNNNNNNNLWPNGRRHRNGTVEAQHSGNYNQDRGLSSRAWNKQTENPNSLGLTDTPFQGHESRDKGSKRQFNVLSDAQGPGVAGRPLSFAVFDVNSSNNRNAETGGAEFSVELSNSLIMSANDTMKTENVGGHRGGQYRPENVRGGAGDGSERTFRRDNSANEETRINNNNNSSNSPGFSSIKHHRRELGAALAGTPGFKGDRPQSHHHGQGHVQGQLLQPQGHHQGHTQAQQPVSQAQAQGEQGGGNSPRFRTTERRGSGDGGSGGGGSSEGGGGGGAGHFTDFRHSLPGMMPSSPYPSTGLSGLQQHHLHHHHHQQQQQQQQHPASIRMPTRASPPGLGTFQQAFPPPATAAALLPPPPIRGLPNGPFSSAVNPSPSLHHPPPPPSLPVGVVWPLVPLPPPTNLPLVDNAFYQAPAFNN